MNGGRATIAGSKSNLRRGPDVDANRSGSRQSPAIRAYGSTSSRSSRQSPTAQMKLWMLTRLLHAGPEPGRRSAGAGGLREMGRMLGRRPGDGMEHGSRWARLDAKLLPPLRLHHLATERFPAMPDAGAGHKVSRYPEFTKKRSPACLLLGRRIVPAATRFLAGCRGPTSRAFAAAFRAAAFRAAASTAFRAFAHYNILHVKLYFLLICPSCIAAADKDRNLE